MPELGKCVPSDPPGILADVAGGMRRRNAYDRRPLAERGRTVEPVTSPPPELKHVWVTDEHGRRAGLLLRWERRSDGWWARVSYAARDAEGWALVEEWLPAGVIERA